MNKYMVIGDFVVYGGPKNYSRDKIYIKNSTLNECIEYVKAKTLINDVDINYIFSSKEDQMGCYSRYEIIIDKTIETIWINLSKQEKERIFSFAESWIQNEMVQPDDLIKKIQGYYNFL